MQPSDSEVVKKSKQEIKKERNMPSTKEAIKTKKNDNGEEKMK